MELTGRSKCSWLILWFLGPYFLPAAETIKCLSCTSNGITGSTCENTTSHLDCDTALPASDDGYSACYSLTKIMNYPLIGIRTEVEKNCTIDINCQLFEKIMCYDEYNLTVSCSVDCCSGDFCNGNSSNSRASLNTSNVITKASASVSHASLSWQTSVIPTSGNSTRQIPTVVCSTSSLCQCTDMLLLCASLVVVWFQNMYN